MTAGLSWRRAVSHNGRMQQPLAAENNAEGRTATRRLFSWAIGGVCALTAGLLAVMVVVQRSPDFYRTAVVPGESAVAESLARRMVSKAAALHAAAGRSGPWEAVIGDSEVNAWLAVDLPRNHGRLLPEGVESPRISFQSRRVAVAARMTIGPVSAVAWADMEVWLQGVNQVGLKPVAAGLGGLPVPRDAMLRHLAGRLSAAGLVTDLRRTQGGLLLVVSPTASSDAAAGNCRLESLAVDAGELLVAGTTQQPAEGVDLP